MLMQARHLLSNVRIIEFDYLESTGAIEGQEVIGKMVKQDSQTRLGGIMSMGGQPNKLKSPGSFPAQSSSGPGRNDHQMCQSRDN